MKKVRDQNNSYQASAKELSERRSRDLAELCQKLELNLRDYNLLDSALTHRSFLNEAKKISGDYERLEFLGDAILGMVISEYLYNAYSDRPEGELSRMKAELVSRSTLGRIGAQLELGRYLRLGRGESVSGGHRRESTLADVLEAIIAVVYLELGIESASSFILDILEDELQHSGSSVKNPKSRLQEFVQKQRQLTPVYKQVSSSGPDHQREFICAVWIGDEEVARGSGSSHKRAASAAATRALKQLQVKSEE